MRRLLALFFAVCFTATALFGAEVVLKSGTVNVAKKKIYLSDVAERYDGIDSRTKEKLEAIYLKMAPVPGYRIVITREDIQNRVWKNFKTVKVTGPEKVQVATSKALVKWEDIKETALKYVKENLPWNPEDAEITVTGVKDDIAVIDGSVLLKVREDSRSRLKGNLVIPVQIMIDGMEYKIEPVSVVIKVVTGCLVAADNIERREIAPIAKTVKSIMDITNLPDDVIIDQQVLSNRAAKRAILKGTVLTESMFEVLPFFRRGDVAAVVVQAGLVRIESQGIAMDDGRQGEKAKVKLENGKIVEGTVGQDGKVLIIK